VVTQRSLAQAFLALQTALTVVLALIFWVQGNTHALAASIAAVVYAACFAAFRRGWEPARHVAVVLLTLLLVAATEEPFLTQQPLTSLIIPPIVALMLTSSRWIVGSAALGLAGLAVRSDFRTPLLQPGDLLVFVMAVTGLVFVRRSVDVAMARLKAQADSAELALARAEAAASEAIVERNRAGKLEAELIHMQRLESVGRLAGGVAHDFNNLLTVIGASASMAERALATGGSVTDELQEVHHAVERASELTKQLLAFARKQVLVKRNVELGELVSSVERMLRRLIGERLTLSARLSTEPLRIMADAGQIEQVIVNLVINARDAITGSGQIELVTQRCVIAPGSDADAAAVPPGEYACIEVSDNGVGMTSEVQQRLFEPFFTTKTPGRGTGLGLATSFGIVRQHEGTIRAESEPGKGTIMRVYLPLASAHEGQATSGVVAIAMPRKRVLVVEDEPQVRAIAARALSNAGYDVLQAANGAEGLVMVREQNASIDVVVTDVVMPELSGPELARAVRAFAPSIGWVFMSGFPESMHQGEPGEFEDAIYLAKPFSPQKLIEAVKDRLERGSAAKRSAER
jgi:signal transduction histidine kinase/ActR/RegA family two-component response regulator